MNHDRLHRKKPIIRDTDLTVEKLASIRNKHDLMIGFAHANEEQSYHPLRKTRDRWVNFLNKDTFDVIVGHGPHVVAPAEQINEKGLIFHSIGNFVSPVGPQQTKWGCIPEITISHTGHAIQDLQYKVHFSSQERNVVSLVDPSTRPPRIHKLFDISKNNHR